VTFTYVTARRSFAIDTRCSAHNSRSLASSLTPESAALSGQLQFKKGAPWSV
jgi:hypothetical protein